jgi:hypothetical protein
MEVTTVEKLGKENGIERKKISLTNPVPENVMAKAHSYYTKKEKKKAKLNHKNRKQ